MVRLLPIFCGCLHQRGFRFNPTMVRLLPIRRRIIFTALQRFQSHNGAIAASYRAIGDSGAIHVSIPQWCDCCWNMWIHSEEGDGVSIPQWCDCCKCNDLCGVKDLLVSIPQWCDCCQGKNLGFDGKTEGNGKGVAVDLRLAEKAKGVDGN